MRAFSSIIPLVAAAVAVGTLTAAMPAARHTHLLRSEPASNDTLATSPKELKLWFSERVELGITTVKLASTSGEAKALAAPALDTDEKAPVVVTMASPLPAGAYTIAWKAAGKDGHPSTGTIAFVVRGAR